MNSKVERKASLFRANLLEALIERLDSRWRHWDLRQNTPEEAGPERPMWRRVLLAPGHPRFLSWLSMLLVVSLALGPTLEPSSVDKLVLAVAGLIGLGCVNLVAHYWLRVARWLLLWQLMILAAVLLAAWIIAGPEAREIHGGVYRHVGMAGVVLLVLALSIDWLVALGLFVRYGGRLASALPKTELFAVRFRQGIASTSLWHAMFVVPFHQPLELLFVGSVVLLLVPGDGNLWPWFLFPNLLAWAVLAAGGLSDRIQEMINTLGRVFFQGPPAVISIVIVALSLLRLGDVHYISYFFNLQENSWNWTLLAYASSGYLLAWYYAYWSARFELYRLLRCLVGQCEPPWRAAYPFIGTPVGTMLKDGRRIFIHGGGRFAVTGSYCTRSGDTGEAFHFHRPEDLLLRVQQTAETGGGSAEAARDCRVLRHRSRFYSVWHIVLPYALVAAIAFIVRDLPQKPELEVAAAAPAKFDLVKALRDGVPTGACTNASSDAPRVALAASGGGTRASMYTASMLRGLAEAGHICDIVLVSGVSGGSVGLAYFALQADDLRRESAADPVAWERFLGAVTQPFIQDALDGLSEWRVAIGTVAEPDGEEPRGMLGVRTGELLAESLEERLGGEPARSFALERVPFALILNASLAGASARWRWDSDQTDESAADFLARFDAGACGHANGEPLPVWLPERDRACKSLVTSAPAGGRLAVTNLGEELLGRPAGGPPEAPAPMPLVVLRDKTIPVVRAAALSANFPPVFSNAAIDRYPGDGLVPSRYWVTDGGAVENRATLTMLSALAAAAERLRDHPGPLPPLHIVVADVSAPGGVYQQDRGIGSALGAGAQLGRALERILFERIRDAYGTRGRVFFHELAMPNALRAEGVGTHWMLPASVRLHCPAGILAGEGGECQKSVVSLSREEVVALVDWLHRDTAPAPQGDAAIVRSWIEKDRENNHRSAWARLRVCLENSAACD